MRIYKYKFNMCKILFRVFKLNKFNSIFDQNGNSTIMIMAIMSTLTLIVMGFSASSNLSLSYQIHAENKNKITTLRNNLISILSHDLSWMNTIEDPVNQLNAFKIDCLLGNTTDQNCSGAKGLLRILAADKSIYYDPINNPTHGFTLNGVPCTTFVPVAYDTNGNRDSSVKGNNECPIRLTFNWSSECFHMGREICKSPLNHITGKFEFNFGSSVTLDRNYNPENYNFTIQRPSEHP